MTDQTPAEPLSAAEEAYVRAQTEVVREFERRAGRNAPAAEHLVSRLLATLDAERAAAREGAGGLDVALLARAQAIADGLAGGADELDHGYAMTVAAEYARLATAQKETPR